MSYECPEPKPTLIRKKIDDESFNKIKEILGLDPRAPLIVYAFDPTGNIELLTAKSEFNESPFELRCQRVVSIEPALFMTTDGSPKRASHSCGGESNTQTYPHGY